MKVVVIGGGASGLVAAIYASSQNEVILLEKNKICGKKISITGNGKCNFMNEDFTLDHFYSENKEQIPMIENPKEKILNLMNQIGVEYYSKNGYYYPLSNQATTIQNALIKEALVNGVQIIYDVEVNNIEKKQQFQIQTNRGVFEADRVILATGSKAYPKTGSDGIGYEILQKMGHTIVPIKPALTSIETYPFYKDLSGVRTNVVIQLYHHQKMINQETGELQFTDYGISGICAMNISNIAYKKDTLKLDLIPTVSNFISYMDFKNKTVKNRTVQELLDGLLNYKIVNLILKLSSISNQDLWDSISNSKKEKLCQNLKQLSFDIMDFKGFDRSQVCSGGLSLLEITDNLESKKVPGLYVTGELLDVIGDCGGYNLSFAFITGMIAGSNIK